MNIVKHKYSGVFISYRERMREMRGKKEVRKKVKVKKKTENHPQMDRLIKNLMLSEKRE